MTRACGSSRIEISCPFCDRANKIPAVIFQGPGSSCIGCGAILKSSGSFQKPLGLEQFLQLRSSKDPAPSLCLDAASGGERCSSQCSRCSRVSFKGEEVRE